LTSLYELENIDDSSIEWSSEDNEEEENEKEKE